MLEVGRLPILIMSNPVEVSNNGEPPTRPTILLFIVTLSILPKREIPSVKVLLIIFPDTTTFLTSRGAVEASLIPSRSTMLVTILPVIATLCI